MRSPKLFPATTFSILSFALLTTGCGSDSSSNSGNGTGGIGGVASGGAGNGGSAAGATSAAGGAASSTGGTSNGSGGAASGGTTASGGSAGSGAGTSATGGVGPSAGGAESDGGAEPDGGGAPKGCRINADCATVPGKPLCDAKNDECVACHTNAQCPATAECVKSACVPLPTCKSSLDCASGAEGKTICDKTNGVCVQCTAAADCGDGKVCTNRACYKSCSSDNECMSMHMLCNKGLTFGGQCTECTTSTECPSGKYCEAGQCVAFTCKPAQQSCTQNLVVQCNDTGSDVIPQQQCALALLTPACIVDGDNAKCVALCEDGKHDALESDVDCGGPMCSRCNKGQACAASTDCSSNKCTSGKCE